MGSYTASGPSGGSASCSSSLNGTVTNTSSLTTVGTHTITCTATTGAGKTATASKTVKITYTKYTVTNLIGDSSFESSGSGWDAILGTIVTSKYNSGSKSLYCNDTSDADSCWNRYSVTIDQNDIIYMKAYVYSVTGYDTNSNNYAGVMAITVNGAGNTLHFKPTTRNVWSSYSSVVTATSNFDTFQIGVATDNTGTSYYDDILVINLTDTFGSGNEPDLTWCNKHISYFDGTTNIYK